jgi:Arc/MetJ-type ribon-helix-helix transcriptional regulator
MPAQTVRTTLTLPVELLEAADRAVRTGRARSRNELVARALRHELAALERAAIDAAFATLGDDPDHLDEVRALEMEFATASWEAFRQGEDAS